MKDVGRNVGDAAGEVLGSGGDDVLLAIFMIDNPGGENDAGEVERILQGLDKIRAGFQKGLVIGNFENAVGIFQIQQGP